MYDELNITEIAWKMNYSSVAHLSNQFKKFTGLSPSHFKKLRERKRNPIEEIGVTSADVTKDFPHANGTNGTNTKMDIDQDYPDKIWLKEQE